MVHNLKLRLHLLRMRYLMYTEAIIAAVKDAHREMQDYADSLAELVARTSRDLD
jgi:hypothetical protein